MQCTSIILFHKTICDDWPDPHGLQRQQQVRDADEDRSRAGDRHRRDRGHPAELPRAVRRCGVGADELPARVPHRERLRWRVGERMFPTKMLQRATVCMYP